MGFWRRLFGIENRAEAVQTEKTDTLLEAIFGETSEITRETALQIPTISGGVDLIGNIIAGTPIKLFREVDGKAEEIKDDPRVRILNDETGDTLNANEFWRVHYAGLLSRQRRAMRTLRKGAENSRRFITWTKRILLCRKIPIRSTKILRYS